MLEKILRNEGLRMTNPIKLMAGLLVAVVFGMAGCDGLKSDAKKVVLKEIVQKKPQINVDSVKFGKLTITAAIK